jgi:hypothetical protein
MSIDSFDPEDALLFDGYTPSGDIHPLAVHTAPIVTGDVLQALGNDAMPQRVIYGRILSQQILGFPSKPESAKLYVNSNTPFSALICGVQVGMTTNCFNYH